MQSPPNPTIATMAGSSVASSFESDITPAPLPITATKELPAEVLNTGDVELPEPLGSGGQEPCHNEAVAAVPDGDQARLIEPEQPIVNSLTGDVEVEDATAGVEVSLQPPASDNQAESERENFEVECETDSDPCLDVNSDSESDSESSDSDEDGMITRDDLDRFMADPKKNAGLLASLVDDEVPRTKNEMDPTAIAIPDRRSMLIPVVAKLYSIGTISSFVEGVMVIKSNEGSPTVDLGSALALGNRDPLGWIDDIIGPVDFPFYLVRLRDDHGIPSEQIAPGTAVFAVEELCQYLRVSTLDTKGTDASHQHDEENPDIVYYSDDEQERLAKKKTKAPSARRATGPPQPGARRTSGERSDRGAIRCQTEQKIGPPYQGGAVHGRDRGEVLQPQYHPQYHAPTLYQDVDLSFPYEGSRIRPPYQGNEYRPDQYHHPEPRFNYMGETWQDVDPDPRRHY